jgi:hypothetical protein
MPGYTTLLAFAGLFLFLVACQPATTPAPMPTASLTATSLIQRSATPDAAPTTTEPDPTPTTSPVAPTPTEKVVMPEVMPTATLSPTAPSEPAANADVEHVRAVQASDDSWTFYVTVRHPDTGWEDYADGWDVLTPDGTVIKPDPSSPFTRLLLHPHETEQPFTRSQSGIVIPPDVNQVRVRVHDLVDGFGGREVIVDLTISSGTDFEVERK